MLKRLLLLCAAFTAAASSYADTGVYIQLDPDTKTGMIAGFAQEHTSGEVVLPSTTKRDGETYTVVGVLPHALDNMKNVTSVTIPASYKQLGNITSTTQDVTKMEGKGAAFLLNCSDLKKIEFDGASPLAKVTGAGILVSTDGKDTYLVPPRISVTDNTLRMSSTCTRIGAGAFNLNAGIATLAFPPELEFVAPDAGFHKMFQITNYQIASSNPTYKIYNNALINQKTSTLVSLPRYYQGGTSYYVDYTRTLYVGDYAFANNTSVVNYNLPGPLKGIGDYAFSGSAISAVTIYPDVDLSKGGKGAFSNCARLASITFKKADETIPADFASDCRILSQLTFEKGRPKSVGARAFRNCTSLSEFPFAADIQWGGDSIFANTGFTEVEYTAAVFSGQDVEAQGIFAGCRQLRKLDISGVVYLGNTNRLAVTKDFASDCPKLEEIIFPNYVDIVSAPFDGDNAIKKIILSNFTTSYKKVFTFTGAQNYEPKVYLQVPYGRETASSPISGLFGFTDGATGTVSYYCAGYYCPFDADKRVENALIYVPGGSKENYPEWANPKEMFSFSASGNEEGITVKCAPAFENVALDKVAFGYSDTVQFDGKTEVSTATPLSSIDKLILYYTVDDVAMWTQYPATVVTAATGVESVNISDAPYIRFGGKMLSFGAQSDYTICNLSGAVVMSGVASEVSLDGMAAGVYIVKIAADGKLLTAKIILD